MLQNIESPRVQTVRLSSLGSPEFRLDAKHYQEEFVIASRRVTNCGYDTRPLSELAEAYVPNRTKLVTVTNPSAGAPYLKAHDAFMTRPTKKEYMSAARTREYESYLLKKGMILTTSSGRNLGPIAYVGTYLSQFAMTDIMRIVPHNTLNGMYLLAYLMTSSGQALIRRGRTGTTVDHLSPTEVLKIPVPWLPAHLRSEIALRMEKSETLFNQGQQELDMLEEELHSRAGLPSSVPAVEYPFGQNKLKAFSEHASALALRIDAAYYDTQVKEAERCLRQSSIAALASCAQLQILGRYKRYYVTKGHGTPILSGRQILQRYPVNLMYISHRSFSTPADYQIRNGMTLFTCDGRSEESLGSVAFVSSLWDGWMASNHVMRVIPNSNVTAGYLYISLRSPYVQLQLKARATGSVVDALEPKTVSDVLIPFLGEAHRNELGKAAEAAWEKIAESIRISDQIVSKLERLIVEGYEAGQ